MDEIKIDSIEPPPPSTSSIPQALCQPDFYSIKTVYRYRFSLSGNVPSFSAFALNGTGDGCGLGMGRRTERQFMPKSNDDNNRMYIMLACTQIAHVPYHSQAHRSAPEIRV